MRRRARGFNQPSEMRIRSSQSPVVGIAVWIFGQCASSPVNCLLKLLALQMDMCNRSICVKCVTWAKRYYAMQYDQRLIKATRKNVTDSPRGSAR